MILTETLTASNIELRNLTVEDAEGTYAMWMNDLHVLQYTEARFHRHTKESLRTFILEKQHSSSSLLLGIFYNDEHIGNIKLEIDAAHKRGEIGIIIGSKNHWGKGYGYQAISLLKEYACSTLKVKKLTAGCYSNNIASLKTFQKAGFEIEATLKEHFISDKNRVDCVKLAYFSH